MRNIYLMGKSQEDLKRLDIHLTKQHFVRKLVVIYNPLAFYS